MNANLRMTQGGLGSNAQAVCAAPKAASRRLSISRQAFHCLVLVPMALASYLFISHYVLQSVQVVGISMIPTLRDADHYLMNRLVFHLRDPGRGEVVVLRDPIENTYAVKRIVGLAGDLIAIKDGRVFVNGQKLKEAYLPPKTWTYPEGNLAEQRFVVGPNAFFVLGDNRVNSTDSRVYGAIPRQSILGLISL